MKKKICKNCVFYVAGLPDDTKQGTLSSDPEITGRCVYNPPQLIPTGNFNVLSMFARELEDRAEGFIPENIPVSTDGMSGVV